MGSSSNDSQSSEAGSQVIQTLGYIQRSGQACLDLSVTTAHPPQLVLTAADVLRRPISCNLATSLSTYRPPQKYKTKFSRQVGLASLGLASPTRLLDLLLRKSH